MKQETSGLGTRETRERREGKEGKERDVGAPKCWGAKCTTAHFTWDKRKKQKTEKRQKKDTGKKRRGSRKSDGFVSVHSHSHRSALWSVTRQSSLVSRHSARPSGAGCFFFALKSGRQPQSISHSGRVFWDISTVSFFSALHHRNHGAFNLSRASTETGTKSTS